MNLAPTRNARRWKILLGVAAAALAAAPALGQAGKDRTVDQFLCKDVMRESGSNRDVAIAFLHGYLLGKSGGVKFNVDTLRKQSDGFIERCLDNPGDKAVDVMTAVTK